MTVPSASTPSGSTMPSGSTPPAASVAAMTSAGLTLGCAESLTAGLLAGTVAEVPGASAVLVGGVVAYATWVKAAVLGVDADLLAARGAVDPEVAAQMATGICRVLRCDLGLATTGVAGPDPQDGHPVGEVYVALAWPFRAVSTVRALRLTGDRAAIRAATVDAALDLLAEVLGDAPGAR